MAKFSPWRRIWTKFCIHTLLSFRVLVVWWKTSDGNQIEKSDKKHWLTNFNWKLTFIDGNTSHFLFFFTIEKSFACNINWLCAAMDKVSDLKIQMLMAQVSLKSIFSKETLSSNVCRDISTLLYYHFYDQIFPIMCFCYCTFPMKKTFYTIWILFKL